MVKGMEFEGLLLRSKVPIPFVEENFYLPQKIYIEGYFPTGTVFKLQEAVCSKKLNPFGDQINDYCHAVALVYTNKLNGAAEEEEEQKIIFHVDLSALFLLLEPIDSEGNPIEL